MYKIIGADGEEYGPVSADQMRAWLIEGRADGRTMAQAAGSATWQPLSAFPEFTSAATGAGAARPGTPPMAATPGLAAPLRPQVPTYLVWSILLTVLCCLLGFPSIIYSIQVSIKLDRGDIEGAKRASRKAYGWCWASFIIGAIQYLVSALSLGWFLKNTALLH